MDEVKKTKTEKFNIIAIRVMVMVLCLLVSGMAVATVVMATRYSINHKKVCTDEKFYTKVRLAPLKVLISKKSLY